MLNFDENETGKLAESVKLMNWYYTCGTLAFKKKMMLIKIVLFMRGEVKSFH